MVFGSDWAYAAAFYGPEGDPQPALGRVFSAQERGEIDALNVRRQFARLS
jgi:hypothetical protein